MYIDMNTLFLYMQYVDHPIYNYFDRKSYTIIQVENPNNPPQSTTEHYEQYIQLLGVNKIISSTKSYHDHSFTTVTLPTAFTNFYAQRGCYESLFEFTGSVLF